MTSHRRHLTVRFETDELGSWQDGSTRELVTSPTSASGPERTSASVCVVSANEVLADLLCRRPTRPLQSQLWINGLAAEMHEEHQSILFFRKAEYLKLPVEATE